MQEAEFGKILRSRPHLDREAILRALAFASRAHAGQYRRSGDPYLTHPLQVAARLVGIGLDTSTVIAGLLHDVCENTPVTLEAIRREFGEEVASFVDGVSKLDKFHFTGIEHQAETLRKMFLAVAEDVRVALVKLADRLHNMETIRHLPPETRYQKSLETMEIYAPLAQRLGMGEWKGLLEDLAFPYVYPKEYAWLIQHIQEAYGERRIYIERILPRLGRVFGREGVGVLELHARPKHHWSLYQKLLRNDMNLGKIHDLVAVRIIVATVADCYAALGAIHKHWTPLPGKIKDYIALPKGSGYQSLHTTVFCIGGKITEFQVRTPEMHREAEFGIAAHWLYASKRPKPHLSEGGKQRRTEADLNWVRQIKQWQQAVSGSKEFLEALKLDFLKNRIFVFTPKGDVLELPSGATAIDFAYAVHTEVGHRAVGAKADGRIIPLDRPLPSGVVVEILTKKEPDPKRGWLLFVKTTEARRKIRTWFNRQRPAGTPAMLAVPAGSAQQPPPRRAPKHGKHPLIIAGGSRGVLTTLARCCKPLPGDNIEGYVSRSRGITVHKSSCRTVSRPRSRERLVPVRWEAGGEATYPATLKVYAGARVGLIKDISETIARGGINILAMTSFETPDREGITTVTVEVRSAEALDELLGRLRRVKGVHSIEQV